MPGKKKRAGSPATGTSASKGSGSSSADAKKVEKHRQALDDIAEGTIEISAPEPRQKKGKEKEAAPEPEAAVSGDVVQPFTKAELRPMLESITILAGAVEPELGADKKEVDTLTEGWFPLASQYPEFFRGAMPWPVAALYGVLITVAVYKPKAEALQARKQYEAAQKKQQQIAILNERTAAEHEARQAEGRAAEERSGKQRGSHGE